MMQRLSADGFRVSGHDSGAWVTSGRKQVACSYTFSGLVQTKLGETLSRKEMLLAVGDRYENDIAAARAADAKYR